MRLGWTAEQCLNASPDELATQIWGERVRRNRRLAEKSWEIAWTISPHVSSKDKDRATMQRILYTAPGYEPDEGELK